MQIMWNKNIQRFMLSELKKKTKNETNIKWTELWIQKEQGIMRM